ncbi:MAG: hypothetical protein ACOCZ5_01815 [bacterium]
MKTIDFRGQQYTIPTSWDDITLEKQMRVSQHKQQYKNKYTEKLALVSGYCDIPIDEIKKSTVSEASNLFKHLKFLSKKRDNKPIYEFKFKGDNYTVVQNLGETEFQDYVSFETAIQNFSGDTIQALPYMLAILCKKKKDNGELESLDDYDIEERAEMFKQLKITIAEPLSLFFYQSEMISRIASNLYSNPAKAILMKAEEAENTLKKADGKGLLSKLLIGILRKYVKFIKKDAMKYSNSIQ